MLTNVRTNEPNEDTDTTLNISIAKMTAICQSTSSQRTEAQHFISRALNGWRLHKPQRQSTPLPPGGVRVSMTSRGRYDWRCCSRESRPRWSASLVNPLRGGSADTARRSRATLCHGPTFNFFFKRSLFGSLQINCFKNLQRFRRICHRHLVEPP